MAVEVETDSLCSGEKCATLQEKIPYKSLKKFQVDKPYHKVRESLFSSSTFRNMNNWGISNLCLAILVLSNVSLAVENISKYGISINTFLWFKIYFSKLTEIQPILILTGLNIFPLFSLGLEILFSKVNLNDKVYVMLCSFFLTLEILVPPFAIHYIDSFAVAFTIVVSYITVFLKLISYHMFNFCCRQHIAYKTISHDTTDKIRQKDFGRGDEYKTLIQYPDNLNVKDIYYFVFAPTLCYELNFPLLSQIRKSFLIKRVIEMFFLVLLILSIIQQLIIPIVLDYQDNLQDMDYIKVLELYIKLIVPFYTVWILCFCFIFHSWLNFIGEILRFGDRFYYSDWWNAESMAHWWRKWNIPVHNWCLRHMYIPMLQSGYTKFQAISAVFFVSGVFHEYLFSLPLKIYRTLMFIGIFGGQMSYFAFATDAPSKYSNISLCLNNLLFQPFLLLYYYYGYYVEHFQNMKSNM